MQVYDEAVLQCFLENQGKLFPEEDESRTFSPDRHTTNGYDAAC